MTSLALGRRESPVPWYVATTLVGSLSIVVGLLWDISWHVTIGRDTFWTPAHLAIHLGGLLGGLTGGALVLQGTFLRTEGGPASIRFWGFLGPLGAWVAIWGALAMLTSAPFDDWWHSAYGLDVQIVSPPHSLLAFGMFGVQVGAMLLVLAAQNRAGNPVLTWAYVLSAGLLLAMAASFTMEYSDPNSQHAARFFEVSAALYPLFLVAFAWPTRLSFGATSIAGVYMLVRAAMTWILPLFEAHPRLAPIFNPVDHMWPTPFPLLLVLPALAIDLLLRSRERRSALVLAALLAMAFLVLFVPSQWLFSDFMLSPWARNHFFGADQWEYTAPPGDWRYRFWQLKTQPMNGGALATIALLAYLSCLLGILLGRFLRRVRR
jgi:hypothetical protein